jgi:hypothetical protein
MRWKNYEPSRSEVNTSGTLAQESRHGWPAVFAPVHDGFLPAAAQRGKVVGW